MEELNTLKTTLVIVFVGGSWDAGLSPLKYALIGGNQFGGLKPKMYNPFTISPDER